jgi:TPR repeat protein
MLVLNVFFPDRRGRIQHLLASNQDWEEAKLLTRMSGNDPWAQTNLAALYFTDRGVDQDPQEGVRLLSLAAAKRYVPALAALGIAYRDGTGVKRDLAKAAEYLEQAANKGNTGARAALRVLQRE